MTIGVTAAGGGVGHAVIESLRRATHPPEIVGFDVTANNAGMATLDRRALLPPVTDVDAYCEALLAEVERHNVTVLIPGLDPELSIIAGLQAELLTLGCTVVVSDKKVTSLSTDKLALCHFGLAQNLPVAPACSLAEAQARGSELGFPVFVKPIRGSASIGVRLVSDATTLASIVDDGTLLVQEYLPPRTLSGDLAGTQSERLTHTHELSVQVVLDPDGGELGRFASLNTLKHGVPVDIEPVTDSVDLSGAMRWIEALVPLGARGPINLQGRIGPDGVPVYFEVNARFTGITSLRGLMGFREVEAVVGSFTGVARPDLRHLLQARSRVHGFRPVSDVVVARERREPSGGVNGQRRRLGRIVVSGASGYLGTALTAAFADCDDVESVAALDRGEPDSWPTVIAGADTLIHLAGQRPAAGGSVLEFTASNVALSQHLLSISRRAGVSRFLLASTQAVYGTTMAPPWSESQSPRPDTLYGASKWSAELVARASADRVFEVVSVRLARLFGVGREMRWQELPHDWSTKAARAEMITVHGSGEQRMDLLHLKDAVAAMIAIGRTPAVETGEAINVGGGNPVSLNELITTLDTVAQSRGLPELRTERTEHAARATSFGMSIRRAFEVSGWKPTIGLQESLEELVDAAMDAR